MKLELKLKRASRRPRVLSGHPWVYDNELEAPLPSECDGKGVELFDLRGRSLGMGLYYSKSKIAWRHYGKSGTTWDKAYFEAALGKALARRADETVRRIVWSDADDLPGFIVDQFEDILVVQAVTFGADQALEAFSEVLESVLKPSEIVYRNDAPGRKMEGLERVVKTRSGEELAPRVFDIFGIQYELDLLHGQKTGFYLDQREEHLRVAAYSNESRVLDAFCNQGSFGLQCAMQGAREVIGIDQSADAIAAVQKNALLNEVSMTGIEANVFDWFTEHKDERFDLIILDPPSFAPNRRAVEGAMRGYKQLHLRALRMLTEGGLLATYSCSQHISRDAFMEMIADAAHDAGRRVDLVTLTGQPMDHPVRLGFPESSYLKGALLRVE